MRDDDEQTRGERYWRFTFVIGLGLLIAVVSFGAGMLAERDLFREGLARGGTAAGGSGGDFQRLAEVRGLVAEEYFGRPDDEAEIAEFNTMLEYGAIQGMMGALDDYSTFLQPVEQVAVTDQLSGEYQGIGVWVDFPDGEPTIISPMPGSPAEEAGLQAGDVIESADGKSLINISEEDSLALVRGPEGTSVTLSIRREGEPEPLTVVVERRRIPLLSVIYRKLDASNLAVIQVTIFGDRTTEELDQALQRAKEDGVEGIVLDLRNNGGGWVERAQEMVGRFVEPDAGPALYEEFRPGGEERTPEPIIGGDVNAYGLPLAVLVNEGTASAAEIVAGALRDYEVATIVGATTFGKGSVQRVHDFEDGSSVRITFAEWLTPDQHRIQGEGIVPDLAVPGPTEDDDDDPQLRRAVEALDPDPAAATPVP